MDTKAIVSAIAVLAAAAGCSTTPQQSLEDLNMPIIQTKYTADPSPVVIGDTLYLYTSHDEDDGENFHMKDWLLYTTTDMVNWQDRGAVAGPTLSFSIDGSQFLVHSDSAVGLPDFS